MIDHRQLSPSDLAALRRHTAEAMRGIQTAQVATMPTWATRASLDLSVSDLRLALASRDVELNIPNVRKILDSVEIRLGYAASQELPWRSRARLAVGTHDVNNSR